MNTSETSIMFSWTTVTNTGPLTTGYQLTCSPLLQELPTPDILILNDLSATTAGVTGLISGETYNCCLAVTNYLGNSQDQCVTNFTKPPGSYLAVYNTSIATYNIDTFHTIFLTTSSITVYAVVTLENLSSVPPGAPISVIIGGGGGVFLIVVLMSSVAITGLVVKYRRRKKKTFKIPKE